MKSNKIKALTKLLEKYTQKKVILKEATVIESLIKYLTQKAQNDPEIWFKTNEGKTLWKGIGNVSGLHDYTSTILKNKWAKSGDYFIERIKSYLEAGGNILEFKYKPINRERGNWIHIKTLNLPKKDSSKSDRGLSEFVIVISPSGIGSGVRKKEKAKKYQTKWLIEALLKVADPGYWFDYLDLYDEEDDSIETLYSLFANEKGEKELIKMMNEDINFGENDVYEIKKDGKLIVGNLFN